MKIIRNNIIPFPGFKAINLFGVLFVKNNAKIDDVTINHEGIHSKQFIELMILFAVATVFIRWWLPLFSPLFFYAWYVIEWLVHLIRFRSTYIAYRRISFEREAYTHQTNINYLSKRELFSFFEYMG
jgi:hypothetical protein